MKTARRPSVRRSRGGFAASGPNFYVWQEDEASARQWLESLTRDTHRRPRSDDPRKGRGARTRAIPIANP